MEWTRSISSVADRLRLVQGCRRPYDFRRAPLHRHFELMGWSQMQVAQRFWLISMVTGLLGIALALK